MRSFLVFLIFLAVSLTPVSQSGPGVILFLGDSLTAGFGLEESQAYPAHIQQKIDALEMDYTVVNAGISGDTSAGGLRRINWLLRQRVDVLVLALGANDGLRGIDLETTKANLQGIIDKTRAVNPNVTIIIGGMMVPPNLGQEYTDTFKAIYPEIARSNKAVLIPFLLEGVAGEPELNLPDGIHPTAEGHERIAELVWQYLKPVL